MPAGAGAAGLRELLLLCPVQGLVEALQEMLEKLGSRELPAVEKRLSWVPLCEPGEPCAVRKGARIGKLCSCPRGTACNLLILKCS
ncbi:PREDICTED: cocaine- and amphetamine-regulated transcript protein [Nipponia nippon]|uniref:cocaine- and amphetamine-regulated transcript protein n=1 Tax=Nipponia nippon TaxID=128390 RepID=UPI000510F5BB|nr:PREDICTED: cocaine- and amphetamine-regulated transcript protein [Nipponia nippon]